MEKVLINLIFFFVVALVIFLCDYILIMKRKLKSKNVKNEDIMEINYLISKFK